MIAALLSACLGLLSAADPASDSRASVILVVGAPGNDEYGKQFAQWAGDWKKACDKGGVKCRVIGLEAGGGEDRAALQKAIEAEPRRTPAELWIVLIGHGTFDGKAAKFNLRGPDFSAADLAGWCKDFKRPLALVDAASSSAPFLTELSGPDRVIVTATKTGLERNFARFGGFLAEAIGDEKADLDKDGQTSLLESFLIASRRTEEYYAAEGRLATEHALLDDNGDRQGTRADWYAGLRPVKKPKSNFEADGYRAHQFHLIRSSLEQSLTDPQREARNELEMAVIQLRRRKSQMEENEYYGQLETLLRKLAGFYQQHPPAK